MELLNKIDMFLNEANKIPKGLIGWVADYIEARHNGNVKLAKEIKKNIESEIKSLGLDRDDVFGYFGDPDNPREREEVMKNIEQFRR